MIGYAKKIEKIIRESAFDKKKKKPGLKFNPGLALTRVWTTGPWAFLFLPPDDSRSTIKQDRFSRCLNNCLLMHTQLSIIDSAMDTVKVSQRFACANEQSK